MVIGSKEIFLVFLENWSILPKNFTLPDIILQKFPRKPNRNYNFLVKLYTVLKNTAGFLIFHKGALVFSNWDYKRYIKIIKMGGGSAANPPRNLRKFWKLLSNMPVFFANFILHFWFCILPAFRWGNTYFLPIHFSVSGGTFPPSPPPAYPTA